MFFQDLTPESILKGTWYGTHGLHLIGASGVHLSTFLKNLVAFG
jgi:hypothetical protein